MVVARFDRLLSVSPQTAVVVLVSGQPVDRLGNDRRVACAAGHMPIDQSQGTRGGGGRQRRGGQPADPMPRSVALAHQIASRRLMGMNEFLQIDHTLQSKRGARPCRAAKGSTLSPTTGGVLGLRGCGRYNQESKAGRGTTKDTKKGSQAVYLARTRIPWGYLSVGGDSVAEAIARSQFGDGVASYRPGLPPTDY